MALIWASNAGLSSVTAGVEFELVSGSPVIETSEVFSGTTALRINNTSAIEGFRHTFTSTQGKRWFQFKIKIKAAPTNTVQFGGFRITGSPKVGLRMTSGRLLQLYNEEDAAQVGSNSSALSLDTTYRLTIMCDSTTLASTAVEAWIDGTSFASGTINLAANPNKVAIYVEAADATFDIIVGDMTVNDDQGSFFNTLPGNYKLAYLRPNGNGDNSAWAGSDGNSTDNYLLVDETTPNSATDYVQSNTSGQIDEYIIEDPPSEMGSSDTINAFCVGVQAAVDVTTSADPDITLRVKDSGGNLSESASLDCNSSTYQIPSPLPALPVYSMIIYDMPGSSTTAITKSDITGFQIGVRESATDAHFARVSAIWGLVVYTPASGTQYNESPSGGITPSGTVLKEGRKVLAGTLTDSGAVNKLTAKTFTGSLSSVVGTLTKQTSKILSGALSSIVGTLQIAKTTAVALGGAITPSGTLSRLIDKILGSTLTSSGSLEKSSTKSFSGSITPAGSILKQANKVLSGAISSIVGTLEKIKLAVVSISGSIAPSGNLDKLPNKNLSGNTTPQGSLLKSINKLLSGDNTPAGTLLKQTSKILSGTITSIVGTLDKIKLAVVDLVGSITPTGSLLKSTSKIFTGSNNPQGSLEKQTNKVLQGGISPTGSITKIISKILAGILTLAGDLVADFIPGGGDTFFKDLAGELTSSGSIQKVTSKLLTGALTSAGTLIRDIVKTISGALTPSGSLLKSVSKFFSGTLISSGILQASAIFARELSGILTTSGNLFRTTQKSLSGLVSSDGSITKSISKVLSGSLLSIGQITKSISKFFSGLLSSSGILTKIFNLPPSDVPKIYLEGSRILYVGFSGTDDRIVGLEGERIFLENLTGDK